MITMIPFVVCFIPLIILIILISLSILEQVVSLLMDKNVILEFHTSILALVIEVDKLTDYYVISLAF